MDAAGEFEQRGAEMLHYVTSYLENIRSRQVYPSVQPGFMRDLIPDRAPETPESWEDVFKDIDRVIMPGITHWMSPRFLTYNTLSTSYPSMLADILCSGLNINGVMWASSPSATELEVLMMDWLGKLLNLPEVFLHSGPGKGGGLIQGTASECVLTCLMAARTMFFKKEHEKNPDVTMGQVIDRLVVYTSDQAHICVERAALYGAVRMRKLDTSKDGRFSASTLRAAILEDKAKGLIPFFVVATLGTTGIGAFDDLKEIGPICQEHELWLHIDAAYAGSAMICPEFRPLLDGVEFAMSFNFNTHKWLRIGVDCAVMWVQNSELFTEPFRVDPPYLKVKKDDVMPDFRHWGMAFTRRFRSLKMWFVMRMYGRQGLIEWIRKVVRLAHEFEALLKSDDRFEIVGDVVMGLVCFRLKGSNELNMQLADAFDADGRLHLLPTVFKGRVVLRVSISANFSESKDMQYTWDVVKELTDVILNGGDTSSEKKME